MDLLNTIELVRRTVLVRNSQFEITSFKFQNFVGYIQPIDSESQLTLQLFAHSPQGPVNAVIGH